MPTQALDDAARAQEQLLALGGAAYQLAVRVLGGRQDAEDVLQQAYVNALKGRPASLPPAELRAWFFRVTANAAKNHLKGEARRRRREATVREEIANAAPETAEKLHVLRALLESLEADYRVPLALCYEQGLTQREGAAVLEMPLSTFSKRLNAGLERLRSQLETAGYSAGATAVAAALAHTAPPVPATLAAAVAKIVSGEALVKGTGAVAASAAAKGGIAVKIIVSVVAAGVLAGAVAVVNSVGAGFKPAPTTLASPPPAAAPAEGKPAPINEYKGLQEREEVFEFTQKPAVKKEGDKWVITFASKGKCDATVTILDKDGKVIRHLASGVLGANAPHPFQQNSLSQKIEWDGQTDMRKPAPAGCKVKVALGLKAAFERNIAYDPNDLSGGPSQAFRDAKSDIVVAEAGDNIYAGVINGYGNNSVCRVFDRNGKFVKTVWPPPAAEREKVAAAVGVKPATTIWGDKVPALTGKYGPWARDRAWPQAEKVGLDEQSASFAKMLSQITGVAGFKVQNTRPAAVPAGKDEAKLFRLWTGTPFVHLAVDPDRDYLYAGSRTITRFKGKTGELDYGWFGGEMGSFYSEMHVGPDGLLYLRYGGSCNGYHLFRLDQETAKIVPFKSEYTVKDFSHFRGNKNLEGFNSVPQQLSKDCSVAPLGAVWCGNSGNSGCFQTGMNISPDGKIVTGLREVDLEWAKRQGHPEIKDTGSYLSVYDLDGKLLGVNVIGDTGNGGHGVAIDRDGNVYAGFGGVMPAAAGDRKYAYSLKLHGMADDKLLDGSFGSLIKFRGQGGKYPLNAGPGVHAYFGFVSNTPKEVSGSVWAYGGLNGLTTGDCCCHHVRFEMDRHARIWIPANYLGSVMVLDSNGNRIARLGRYGNVDDTEADVKEKKDGLRFVWPRAVAASESALYVLDPHNRRILKAALSYAAEETVPVP